MAGPPLERVTRGIVGTEILRTSKKNRHSESDINTFLDLALDFFNLFLWSGIGTTPHSRLFKFRFQFQVHLDQFFTREGGRQGAEYLLIGYQQFLQSGVKVKTLKFLQEILLSMEVALSMFFLFLPISSFGRHRTVVPLRGTLLPIVQRIH